jgi:hypothetical protein
MSAGRHEAPRPTDPFMAAVLLALASLLALIVVLAIVYAPRGS